MCSVPARPRSLCSLCLRHPCRRHALQLCFSVSSRRHRHTPAASAQVELLLKLLARTTYSTRHWRGCWCSWLPLNYFLDMIGEKRVHGGAVVEIVFEIGRAHV